MCFKDKPDNIKKLYEILKEIILNEFEDIEIVVTKHYIDFKTNNNIVVSFKPLQSYLKSWINLKIVSLMTHLTKLEMFLMLAIMVLGIMN